MGLATLIYGCSGAPTAVWFATSDGGRTGSGDLHDHRRHCGRDRPVVVDPVHGWPTERNSLLFVAYADLTVVAVVAMYLELPNWRFGGPNHIHGVDEINRGSLQHKTHSCVLGLTGHVPRALATSLPDTAAASPDRAASSGQQGAAIEPTTSAYRGWFHRRYSGPGH